ncbi:hypothetical protein NLJ89_g12226 [Agrocybe chaxingu]|uniref:Integrase catalytic domain-containing protein n=1 Tax=Agrocybe chaxingu TaxID=84603 RepID=A0A9W8JMP9_9AGAR|nr:hypothetical protein NLJ89_g12226 [Agrocybe chaxingu]
MADSVVFPSSRSIEYHIAVIFSSAYHPQGNGLIERAHQEIIACVYKCAGNKKRNWPLYLHAALLATRVTTSRVTGYSPYFLVYGIHPIFSFDLDDATWQTLEWHTIARRDEVAEQSYRQTHFNRTKAIEDFNRRHEGHFSFHAFEPGMNDFAILFSKSATAAYPSFDRFYIRHANALRFAPAVTILDGDYTKWEDANLEGSKLTYTTVRDAMASSFISAENYSVIQRGRHYATMLYPQVYGELRLLSHEDLAVRDWLRAAERPKSTYYALRVTMSGSQFF